MVSAVIFDFDNTLVDYVQSDVAALTAVAKHIPVSVNLSDLVDAAVDAIMEFHRLVAEGLKLHTDIHHFRLSRTLQQLGVCWDETLVDVYQTTYRQNVFPIPGAELLLSSLQGKVKLGLLTNAYDAAEQRERLAASGLADYFNYVAICSEIGQYKPERQTFLHVCDQLGVAPGECVYVGDSEMYDVVGAISAGLTTIKLDPNGRPTQADHLCDSLYTVTALIQKMLLCGA